MSVDILTQILNTRKARFDRVFERLITPPEHCATVTFVNRIDSFPGFKKHGKRLQEITDTREEEDEFACLLSHFKAIRKLDREWTD
tara:strand:- start:32250 stop:32507 length:258 start_codon:yes stop_codon:yes gene_type:complete